MMNAKQSDRLATGVIYTLVGVVIATLVFLLGYILFQGVPHISWRFLTTASSNMTVGGGIRDQLFNSLYLLVLTTIISVPIALGAGIYLSEYAPHNAVTSFVRSAIEVLSSLPSIVVGLFGYLVFALKFNLGFSVLTGAIALTVFNLPILTRNIEESLEDVPNLQREAGLSLGLSRWRTTTKIVLPTAIPGILTGIILSAGRVFGEAAALIYTAGQSNINVSYTDWNPFNASSFLNPMRPAETLAVHIWQLNTEGVTPDAKAISAGASAVLIIVILLVNLGARGLGGLMYRRLTGKQAKGAA